MGEENCKERREEKNRRKPGPPGNRRIVSMFWVGTRKKIIEFGGGKNPNEGGGLQKMTGEN